MGVSSPLGVIAGSSGLFLLFVWVSADKFIVCVFIFPHRQYGGCIIFLCPACPLPPPVRLPLSDLFRASAPPYRRPVQSAAHIGDDGQLMSGAFGAWPFLQGLVQMQYS